MTIVRFDRAANRWGVIIGICACLLLVIALADIFFYNQSVNMRHELTNRDTDIRRTKVENAELKDTLYARLDAKTLQSLAANGELTIDNAPTYIKRGGGEQVSTLTH